MSSEEQITGSIQLWDTQTPITMQTAYPRMWANKYQEPIFATHTATSLSIHAPLKAGTEPSACLLAVTRDTFCTKQPIFCVDLL